MWAVKPDLSLFLIEYSISKARIIELQDIRTFNLEDPGDHLVTLAHFTDEENLVFYFQELE